MSLDSGISGQGGAGATDRIALPRRAVRRKNGDDRRIHGRNLPARNRPSRRNSLHRPDGRSPHAGRVASPHRSDQFAEVFQIARGRRHGRDGHVVAQDAAGFQPAVGGTSGRNVPRSIGSKARKASSTSPASPGRPRARRPMQLGTAYCNAAGSIVATKPPGSRPKPPKKSSARNAPGAADE